MIVQAMTAAEHAQRALDLLAEADAHLAASEYNSVSGKLWSAVENAVMAVAVKRGWERESDGYSGLRSMLKRIEKECRADGISSTFIAASLWRNNRDYHFLDEYEYDFFTPSARRFITKLLKLYGWNIRKGGTRKARACVLESG